MGSGFGAGEGSWTFDDPTSTTSAAEVAAAAAAAAEAALPALPPAAPPSASPPVALAVRFLRPAPRFVVVLFSERRLLL